MASSKQLVYIPKVSKNTWLLWSKKAGKVRLRDYREDEEKPIVIDKRTADALELLNGEHAKAETMACFNRIRIDNITFWHELIQSWNVRDGLIKSEGKKKLQTIFKTQCLRHLQEGKVQELRAIIENWISFCGAINTKTNIFNDYDNKAPHGKSDWTKGSGWQSDLLFNSRRDGKRCFIHTGDEKTDFSLAAMELTFAISARSGVNPFVPGKESRIAPDGLGIRKNGFLTVLEVKGPKDERDLLGPVLQAACAATAVVAKADSLCAIARSPAKLRPAYKNARVPKKSSIGLHILTSKIKKTGTLEPWSSNVEQSCRTLLQAFEQLEYIAFSFVVPENTKSFQHVEIDHLIRL
jgi:hypothetical protein